MAAALVAYDAELSHRFSEAAEDFASNLELMFNASPARGLAEMFAELDAQVIETSGPHARRAHVRVHPDDSIPPGRSPAG